MNLVATENHLIKVRDLYLAQLTQNIDPTQTHIKTLQEQKALFFFFGYYDKHRV